MGSRRTSAQLDPASLRLSQPEPSRNPDSTWMNELFNVQWFLGVTIWARTYDPSTGGCCDGLQEDRINRNQGAESTPAFLLSR